MASHSWVRKLFTAPKPRPFRNAQDRDRRLALETLEERVTPADLAYAATAFGSGGRREIFPEKSPTA